jgi:hypothetical protein
MGTRKICLLVLAGWTLFLVFENGMGTLLFFLIRNWEIYEFRIVQPMMVHAL